MEREREMSGLNNDPMETIGAAATAIASVENRRPRASLQKKRWGSCWSINWCFGSHKHKKRIGHAVLVPETTAQGTEAPPAQNPIHQPSVVLPFIAPPSSPASFLQSEPPSCTQSPPGLVSLTSVSANMYSPVPASMFTIGPYAYETQLVSPPVFSTFTTEPSTAPLTPPPEAVQLTTPSSPEVPFARLLDANYQSGEGAQRYPISQYEFQLYQLYSGSNVGRLISPGSGISSSGSSSPFPDGEYTPGGPRFIQSQSGYPSKLFNLDRRSIHRWGSQQGSGSLTPDSVGPRSRDSFVLNKQDSDIETLGNSFYKSPNSETVHDPRISFEITAEDVVRCMAKEPSLAKAVSSSVEFEDTGSKREGNYNEVANCHMGNHGEIADDSSGKASGEEEGGQGHREHRSATLDSIKEFNFDNTDGVNSDRAAIGPNWWANEKALEKEGESYKVWSFFPMIQPGVS